MIKAKLDTEKGKCNIETAGVIENLVEEAAMIVLSVHENIRQEHPDGAAAFQEMVRDILETDQVWGITEEGWGE